MGNNASRSPASSSNAEWAKLEALFHSGGDLLHLQSAFHLLSAHGHARDAADVPASTQTILHADLKAVFKLPPPADIPSTAQAAVTHFNSHMVSEVFGAASEGIDYTTFLERAARCGKLGTKKEQMELLFRSFLGSGEKTELDVRAQSGETASTSAPKGIEGQSQAIEKSGLAIVTKQLEGILLAVWYLTAWNRREDFSRDGAEQKDGGSEDQNKGDQKKAATIQWPDLRPVVDGAFESNEVKATVSDESSSNKVSSLSLEQLVDWAVATLPGLSDVLEPFLVRRCRAFLDQNRSNFKGDEKQEVGSHEEGASVQSRGPGELERETEEEGGDKWKPGMLTPGLAWGMGLALSSGTAKWGVGPRLTDLGCGGGNLTRLVGRPRLLYRSSENGRGMNRFMSHVEGYTGTVLVIIAARTLASGENWTIGALLPEGLENKRSFFGSSSSCLFSLKPAFKVFRSTGRESNFVYCHARVAGQGYQSHPLPEGLGLGGSLGKERVWLDDNATPGKVTVRHHAVDKTFQAGALVPDLGYGGVEARVEDVEVWGLGGSQADSKQREYLEREQRFQEQRRKVDMKKFAEGWQDSPDRLILEWGGART